MPEEVPPHAKLSRFSAERGELEYWIDDEALLGGDPENQIVLDSKSVSGKQARIFFDHDAGAYVLENLGRRGGTLLDGLIVERVQLGSLHVITQGELDFIFVQVTGRSAERLDSSARSRRVEAVPAHTSGGTIFSRIKGVFLPESLARDKPPRSSRQGSAPILAPKDDSVAGPAAPGTILRPREKVGMPRLDARLEAALNKPRPDPGFDSETESGTGTLPTLVVRFSNGPIEYPLKEGRHLIGRSGNCDIQLDDPSISRRHALLTVESGNTVTLEDLQSVNYTFLGDRRVKSTVRVPAGSSVRFGALKGRLLLRSPANE